MYEAYERLLQDQPPDYHTHLGWLERSSPEGVRAALLVTRRGLEGSEEAFERNLAEACAKLR